MTAEPTETFLQRALREKRERQQLDRHDDFLTEPAGDTIAPDSPGYADQARIYCARALESICAEIAGTPEGNRNQTLNDGALRALRWALAGHLNRERAVHALREAGQAAGLDAAEIGLTLSSAWKGANRYGPAHPQVRQRPALQGAPAIDSATGEVIDAEAMLIAARVRELRINDAAKVLFEAEKHARAFRIPPYRRTLTEELAIPDEPVKYAIENLLPAGGNALLAAQFKAGKTTLVLNLVRAFADGKPFLGRYQINPAPGRIAIFNYELSEQQMRSWLRELDVDNTDRVAVLNLRGFALPITAPAVQDWIVSWLKEQEVSMWIADPFARAAVGTEENSNTEVGVWLDTFDVIKQRAGVRDGILPTHTGREERESGQERARGATRLDDWADVRWLLTKNDDGQTFYRATGRDVEQPEEALEYDGLTRTLTMRGGDRAWVARRNVEREVLAYVTANPGCLTTAIRSGVSRQARAVDAALASLIRDHYVRIEDVAGRKDPHYATGKELPA